MHRPSGALCDRARTWAALAPDGELSEIERKLLDAHLTRCAHCQAFASSVAAVADALHREQLLPLTRPVVITSWRRSGYAGLRTVGAVAAVALMAIGIAFRAPLPANERNSLDLPRITNFSQDAEGELAQILRGQGAGLDVAGLQPGRQGLGQPL